MSTYVLELSCTLLSISLWKIVKCGPIARSMKFPFEQVVYHHCTSYGFPQHFDYIFIMYSEYTIYTLHTHYATYVFPIYSICIAICTTDSQLYFNKYKICVQNKCALCTLYTVVCTYSIHIAIVYLPSQEQRIWRALVK